MKCYARINRRSSIHSPSIHLPSIQIDHMAKITLILRPIADSEEEVRVVNDNGQLTVNGHLLDTSSLDAMLDEPVAAWVQMFGISEDDIGFDDDDDDDEVAAFNRRYKIAQYFYCMCTRDNIIQPELISSLGGVKGEIIDWLIEAMWRHAFARDATVELHECLLSIRGTDFTVRLPSTCLEYSGFKWDRLVDDMIRTVNGEH